GAGVHGRLLPVDPQLVATASRRVITGVAHDAALTARGRRAHEALVVEVPLAKLVLQIVADQVGVRREGLDRRAGVVAVGDVAGPDGSGHDLETRSTAPGVGGTAARARRLAGTRVGGRDRVFRRFGERMGRGVSAGIAVDLRVLRDAYARGVVGGGVVAKA